jgi:carbonic anhydrase
VKELSEGRERLRQEAGLDDFKLPVVPDNQAPARALVVTCSESTVLSAFVASLDPLCILQNLGGTVPTTQPRDDPNWGGDDAGWGTVAYALGEMGLNQVVFCGHSECCVPAKWQADNWARSVREFRGECAMGVTDSLDTAAKLPAFKRASQLWLVEQILRMDAYLVHRTCHSEADIRVHALWFDEDQRRVFFYSRDQRQFVLMNQRDMERWFDVLRAGETKV